MKYPLIGSLSILLGFGLIVRADEKDRPKEQTPAEAYKTILFEYEKAQQEFSKAYSAAKTDQQRSQAFTEKYPRAEKFAPRMLKLARENPKDPAAVDALVWIVQQAGHGNEAGQALDVLLRDHIENPKLDAVCGSLTYSQSASADKFLRTVLEKSAHRPVQGQAAYTLARRLKRQADAAEGQFNLNPFAKKADAKQLTAEAEKLFEKVAAEYGDLKHYRGTLGKAAEGDLFEMRNLTIGKEAPDIDGEDIDGKKFKLSDYRGKVVVLDFWGHW